MARTAPDPNARRPGSNGLNVRRWWPALALVVLAAAGVTAYLVTRPVPGVVTFRGDFETGLTPWTFRHGGPQCANTGTPSKPPRYRGTLVLDASDPGQGRYSARISLPITPAGYALTACDIGDGDHPLGLGTDRYYGLMFYIPKGWRVANDAGYVEIAEYGFQNVLGAPVNLELYPDHVTLLLETGACSDHTTANPGCAYRSNADRSRGPNLPGYYAIPVGALEQGRWMEIAMHVHWASNSSGAVQTYYRAKGASTWTRSASFSGYPTVQWDITRGCCYASATDLIEAYTAALRAPLSIWLDDELQGTTLAAVQDAMP